MNHNVLDRVLRSPRLPSLPTIALDVIDLAQQPNVHIDRIADTIRHDPALSSRILKTVNSSFYGQSQTISTISRALVVLGLNAVKILALGFSLVGNIKRTANDGFDHIGYWRRSLYTATAAQTFSQRAGLVHREEAFLGGLLQDLGLVAMGQALGEEYTRLVRKAGGDHAALCAYENEAFGMDHAEVGAALAESWKLPRLLVAPIRYHENPDDADEDVLGLVRSVALGNRVADIFLSEDGNGAALESYRRQVDAWFGVAGIQADPLLKEIHENTDEMGRLFELPTGNLGNPDEILARANDALMQITLQSQQQRSTLEQQNKQLINEVNTDALTQSWNRRAFDTFVEEQFLSATESQPVSLLFLDVDHFKNFNDVHGHAVGDRALLVFAETLRTAVGDLGRVFRYGGEEFAVVCPATDRGAAARVAEQARHSIESDARVRVRDTDGQELRITCSVGVATHDRDTFDTACSLVKAADQGLYAAKSAGRNCLRVYSPESANCRAPAIAAGD